MLRSKSEGWRKRDVPVVGPGAEAHWGSVGCVRVYISVAVD